MNPSNLLWDGERVWLVDWETSGLGDPRADLATLVNMLLLQGGALEALLSAYAAAGGQVWSLAALKEARALAYLAYAAAFVALTTSPGPELARSGLPSLASCYAAMGRGELDLGNDDGRWRLAAANVEGYWALVS